MGTTSSLLRIDGEFTIYRAAELAAAMKTALAAVADGGTLDLDLSEVVEMDSAGVQLLLAASRSAVTSGRALRLTARSAVVDEILTILQLTALFGDVVAPAH